MSRTKFLPFVAAAVMLLGISTIWADDTIPDITLQNGRFEPAQLVVPANTAFKVRVTNADKAAIEWESFELHRERVVQPGETITVYIPALAPGTYKFFDDFHHDTVSGAIVAQ
ncbi:MAG: cupredoxin domain-containing protein [Candidatus Binatia bacterium]